MSSLPSSGSPSAGGPRLRSLTRESDSQAAGSWEPLDDGELSMDSSESGKSLHSVISGTRSVLTAGSLNSSMRRETRVSPTRSPKSPAAPVREYGISSPAIELLHGEFPSQLLKDPAMADPVFGRRTKDGKARVNSLGRRARASAASTASVRASPNRARQKSSRTSSGEQPSRPKLTIESSTQTERQPDLTLAMEAAEVDLGNLRTENRVLVERIAAFRSKFEQERQDALDLYDKTLKELQNMLTVSEEAGDALRADLAQSKALLRATEEQLDHARAQHREALTVGEAARSTAVEASHRAAQETEVAHARAQSQETALKEAQQKHEAAFDAQTQELTKIRAELMRARIELETTSTMRSSAERKLERAKRDLDAEQKQKTRVEEEREEQRRAKAALQLERDALVRDREAMHGEMDKMRAQVSSNRMEKERAQLEVSHLGHRIETLESDLEKASRNATTAEAGSAIRLQNRCHQLQLQLDQAIETAEKRTSAETEARLAAEARAATAEQRLVDLTRGALQQMGLPVGDDPSRGGPRRRLDLERAASVTGPSGLLALPGKTFPGVNPSPDSSSASNSEEARSLMGLPSVPVNFAGVDPALIQHMLASDGTIASNFNPSSFSLQDNGIARSISMSNTATAVGVLKHRIQNLESQLAEARSGNRNTSPTQTVLKRAQAVVVGESERLRTRVSELEKQVETTRKENEGESERLRSTIRELEQTNEKLGDALEAAQTGAEGGGQMVGRALTAMRASLETARREKAAAEATAKQMRAAQFEAEKALGDESMKANGLLQELTTMMTEVQTQAGEIVLLRDMLERATRGRPFDPDTVLHCELSDREASPRHQVNTTTDKSSASTPKNGGRPASLPVKRNRAGSKGGESSRSTISGSANSAFQPVKSGRDRRSRRFSSDDAGEVAEAAFSRTQPMPLSVIREASPALGMAAPSVPRHMRPRRSSSDGNIVESPQHTQSSTVDERSLPPLVPSEDNSEDTMVLHNAGPDSERRVHFDPHYRLSNSELERLFARASIAPSAHEARAAVAAPSHASGSTPHTRTSGELKHVWSGETRGEHSDRARQSPTHASGSPKREQQPRYHGDPDLVGETRRSVTHELKTVTDEAVRRLTDALHTLLRGRHGEGAGLSEKAIQDLKAITDEAVKKLTDALNRAAADGIINAPRRETRGKESPTLSGSFPGSYFVPGWDDVPGKARVQQETRKMVARAVEDSKKLIERLSTSDLIPAPPGFRSRTFSEATGNEGDRKPTTSESSEASGQGHLQKSASALSEASKGGKPRTASPTKTSPAPSVHDLDSRGVCMTCGCDLSVSREETAFVSAVRAALVADRGASVPHLRVFAAQDPPLEARPVPLRGIMRADSQGSAIVPRGSSLPRSTSSDSRSSAGKPARSPPALDGAGGVGGLHGDPERRLLGESFRSGSGSALNAAIADAALARASSVPLEMGSRVGDATPARQLSFPSTASRSPTGPVDALAIAFPTTTVTAPSVGGTPRDPLGRIITAAMVEQNFMFLSPFS